MTGQTTPQPNTRPQQNFSSGRELIEAVITSREQATQARELLAPLENDLPNAEALDGDRIDGVKVLWITGGALRATRQRSGTL